MTYPLCRVIPLVELGRGTTSDPAVGSSTAELTFELGAIVNIDRHHGVGLSAGWVIDADYPAVSVRGRDRRWLYDFNFALTVFPLGHKDIDGLVGMNFLRHFNFEVRLAERLIHLELIKKR